MKYRQIWKNKHVCQLIILNALLFIYITGYTTSCAHNKKNTDNKIQRIKPVSTITQKKNKNLFFRVDSGGHTALIRSLIALPDEEYLISASDDKTIKVWDLRTKKVVKNILGQITDQYGEIYAIALSKDHKYLAASVNYPYHSIRIHNYADGSIHKVLRTSKRTVNNLSFSPDTKYLVTASDRINVWNVEKNFEKEAYLVYPANPVKGLAVFLFKNDYQIISADGNRIVIYSIKNNTIIATQKLEENILSMAFSHNKVACACPKSIVILDLNLTVTSKISTPIMPDALSFSPNGKLLLSGANSDPFHCVVYQVSQNAITKVSTFKKHNNVVCATTFLDDNTAITAGGNTKEIFIWHAKTGELESQLRGCGKTIWAVGLTDHSILWGNEFEKIDQHRYGRLFQKFNLNSFEIEEIDDPLSMTTRLINNYQSKGVTYSLSTEKGGPYDKADAVLIVNQSNGPSKRIVRNNVDGYVHNVFGFTSNGLIISGGANGQLIAYTKDAQKRIHFVGHTGEIMALAIDPQNNRMVSAGTDQSVLLWDLSNISHIDSQTPQTVLPLLSFFFDQNNKWVAWTPEGFFAMPAKTILQPNTDTISRYIGYHFNQGVKKAAQYITFNQVWKLFHRNDLIKSRLIYGNKANKEIQVAKDALGDIDQLISSLTQPPKIIFDWDTSEPIFHNSLSLDLAFDVIDLGGGIGDISYKINSKSVNLFNMNTQPANNKVRIAGKLMLIDGKNVIQIKANNKMNTILSKEALITVIVDQYLNQSSLNNTKREFRSSVRSIEKSITNRKRPPKLLFYDNISTPFKQKSTSFVINYVIENNGGGIGNTVYKVNGRHVEKFSARRKKFSKKKFVPKHRRRLRKKNKINENDSALKREVIAQDNSNNMISEEIHLTLNPGRNIIEVAVENHDKSATSEKKTIIVDVDSSEDISPTLYILSIGVSKYKAASLELNYAASDAKSFLDALISRATPLFGNKIVSTLLMDKDVTYDHIKNGFIHLSKNMKPYDVFVLFIAGHGIDLDGDYYFIPYNLNNDGLKETLKKQSISHNQLYSLLSMVTAQKTVVILDTCYSGLFISRPYLISDNKNKMDSAIARLRHGGGCAFITSSSSRQVSLEGYKQYGVLTYSLLQGMKGDENPQKSDGFVTIHDLSSHVRDEVPDITQERWHYAQVPTSLLYNDNFSFCCRKGYDLPGCQK